MDFGLGIFNKKLFFSEPDFDWSLSQLIWTFCFALILVVSILGNCIVLWIILGELTQRTSSLILFFTILFATQDLTSIYHYKEDGGLVNFLLHLTQNEV